MTIQSRISVALCTYNGSRFLQGQLQSIAAQTRLPDEMIVCDDGSTDDTAAMVSDFANSVSFPIRFVQNPKNLGSTKSFEQAISLCTCDLIALCDQDDVWRPEKLARQIARMDADPEVGGIFSDAELIDENSHLLNDRLWECVRFGVRDQNLLRNGKDAEILEKKPFVTGATFMFRASLRPLFCPIPAEWVHDAWIVWMLALYSKLDFIADPLIRYRIHAGQQIGVDTISERKTLFERLQRNRREGPARRAAHLKELLILERHLASRQDVRAQKAAENLRKKIIFLEDRRKTEGRLFRSAVCVLRNPRHYRRYENGWKSMARDLASIFIWPRVAR